MPTGNQDAREVNRTSVNNRAVERCHQMPGCLCDLAVLELRYGGADDIGPTVHRVVSKQIDQRQEYACAMNWKLVQGDIMPVALSGCPATHRSIRNDHRSNVMGSPVPNLDGPADVGCERDWQSIPHRIWGVHVRLITLHKCLVIRCRGLISGPSCCA